MTTLGGCRARLSVSTTRLPARWPVSRLGRIKSRTQAALKKAKDTLAKSARPRRTRLFALPSVKNLRGRF